MSFDFSSVKKQPIDFNQINKVLQKAYSTIKSAEKIEKTNNEASFTLSYEAMLKTTLALMLSRGYRPKVQLGHHKTLISFSRYILKDFKQLTETYDKIRKRRNKIIYDIVEVSSGEAEGAFRIAEKYFKVVEDKIATDNPQQKLWRP
jgi:uncharacterized protein (UPF0332 family)